MSKINITGGAYNIDNDASEIDYDNTVSGLTSTNVQDAINELLSIINNLKLSNLSDTDIVDPRDGSSLEYSASTQKWVANNILSATIENGIATFNGVTVSKPLVSLLLNIPVTQTGSGTPSPTNIRDFVGVSGANVTRTGINIWNEDWELGTYGSSGDKKSSSSSIRNANPIAINPNTTYYICIPSQVTNIRRVWRDRNGGFILYTNNRYIETTSPDNAYYLDISFMDYGTEYDNDCSVNYPSTDTDYHPYTGNTYTISFGQTVYSAILNVLTGKLSVTHAIVDLGDLTWRYGSGSQVFYTDDLTDIKTDTQFTGIICECFETILSNASLASMTNYSIKRGQNSTDVYIKNTDYTSASDFVTAFTDKKIVYELAEPIEIQLTPTVINTLIGENVIFADVANVTECKYTRK